MIDSHSHIYLDHFKEDLEEVIERAIENGVKKILLPNIDVTSIDDMLEVEARFPDICHAMMGLHPCSVKADYKTELKIVTQWLERREFIAIGEMGTDLYWDKTFWEEQKKAFHYQCELALDYDLPIVIHCRDSIDETIDMVSEYKSRGLKGVFHCFTGNVEQGKQIEDLGFYMGLGGVSTFKNGGMDKVIPKLSTERILLETDAPYLTPTPHRGKRNEPAYTRLIAEKVADFLEMSLNALDELTTRNTNKLFFPDQIEND
ncbi:MAG: TatD family hydrolase [Ekhidna sp.]